jgi:regulatory protein
MALSCRGAALRFLKIRPRSVAELRDKLANKGFEPQLIEDELKYLQSIELLNDRAFTASWIQHRLARPFGFRRIITELKQKGIVDHIISEAVANAKGQYAESDIVFELAERRASRLKNLDPQKRKKRVGDFLLRRGFPLDVVMKVLKKI